MRTRILLSPDALGLRVGAETPEVGELHAYLSRFGWLRLPDQAPVVAGHDRLPEARVGQFDDATQYALAEFQRTDRLELGTTTIERRGAVGYLTHGNPRFLNAEDDSTTRTLS